MTSTFREGRGWGVEAKMICYQAQRYRGLATVLDFQSLYFY